MSWKVLEFYLCPGMSWNVLEFKHILVNVLKMSWNFKSAFTDFSYNRFFQLSVSVIVWNLVFYLYTHPILHATIYVVWKDLSVRNQFISSLCLKQKIFVWKDHHFVGINSYFFCAYIHAPRALDVFLILHQNHTFYEMRHY